MDTHTDQVAIKRALIIGISYYNTLAELPGCANDIKDVKKYLMSIGFTNITVLRDRAADSKYLHKFSPTRENIIAWMKKTIAETQPNDTLYIHYSGHGSHIQDLSGDETDGEDECICPVDYSTAGMITDDDLNNILVGGLATGAKLRVVFDCCHSGTALDLPVLWVSGNMIVGESTPIGSKDIMFISGCKDTQTSADASFNGRANGALTRTLLDTLSEFTGKNTIRYKWKEFGEMLQARLRANGYPQVPQLCMVEKTQLDAHVDLV